jgi:circadian clock protein KaiB
MNEPQPIDRVAEFEAFLRAGIPDDQQYVLRLYVTGSTPRSTRAIQNLRALCEEHLHGRYDLQVIDIYQQPANAKREQIIAAPTLVKTLPAPIRKLVGDMSNTEQVLLGLDLRPKQ